MAEAVRASMNFAAIVDALLYVVKTGCQWRQLPVNFPPWLTVYQQFRAWRTRDVGASEQNTTRAGPQGRRTKRHTHRGDYRFAVGQDGAKRGRRGYDAGKKIKGRKRHIAVDTQGNLLTVVVHSAGIRDRVGARAVLVRLFCRFDTIVKVFVDGGYTGTLIEWASKCSVTTSKWSSEMNYICFEFCPNVGSWSAPSAWLNWSRRLSKDYELLHTSAETMIHIAFAHLLLRRCA